MSTALQYFSGQDDVSALGWWSAPLVVLGAPSPWGPFANEADAIRAAYDDVGFVHPEWTEGQKQIAVAIGWAESRLGVTPDFQFKTGDPSWNWGAVVASQKQIDAGMFITHADHTADNKPTTMKFAAFLNQTEGFEYWADRWPGLAAAKDGNARGVAEAMYASCWFSATCPPYCTDATRIEAYAQIILGASQKVAKTLGIPLAVTIGTLLGLPMGKCAFHDKPTTGGGGSSSSSADSGAGIGTVLGVAAVGLVAFLVLS